MIPCILSHYASKSVKGSDLCTCLRKKVTNRKPVTCYLFSLWETDVADITVLRCREAVINNLAGVPGINTA